MKYALLMWGLVCLSPFSATGQIALLRLRIVEGEAGVHHIGSKAVQPLTVEVTDELGKPQAGAAVSFHLPEDGPSGSFSNGLRTTLILTNGEGRATLRNLQLNHTPGPFRIRITAVKDQARAGIVSQQYIAGSEAQAKMKDKHHRKWVVIVLVAGSVAGGALGATSRATKNGSSTAPGTPPPVSVSVGAPTITLGKP